VKSAGLTKYISLEVNGVKDVKAPSAGCMLVTNPPYGERITSDDILGLYASIGSTFKHKFQGSKCWLISSHIECLDKIGLKSSERVALLNGTLECWYNCYDIFEGKRNDFVMKKKNISHPDKE
jgi:putative N6-adenine-specific DNA methylase